MIRPAKPEDFEQIKKLHEQFGEFPIEGGLGVIVSEENGVIKGFGTLVLLTEMLMVLDKNSSPRDRIKAFNEILGFGKNFAGKRGISELYAFVKDPKFSEILRKHYNFESCIGDALLVRI